MVYADLGDGFCWVCADFVAVSERLKLFFGASGIVFFFSIRMKLVMLRICYRV